MAHHHLPPGQPAFGHHLRHPAQPGAGAIDADHVGMAVQALRDHPRGDLVIVAPLDRGQRREAGKLLGQHLVKADPPLDHVARLHRIHHHRHAAAARPGKAAHQHRRGAPRRHVVDADEMVALGIGLVGDQRHHRHAARLEPRDQVAHHRRLVAHHRHAVHRNAFQPAEHVDQRHRIADRNPQHLDLAAVQLQPQRRLVNRVLQHLEELAGRVRQQEGKAIAPLPGQVGGRDVAHIAQPRHRLAHPLDRDLAHPGAFVQHPVHGGQADAGLSCDIMYRGFAHAAPSRRSRYGRILRYVNQNCSRRSAGCRLPRPVWAC